MFKALLSGSVKKWALPLVAGLLVVAVAGTLSNRTQAQTGKKKAKGPEAVVVDQMAPGVPGQTQVDLINRELERLWKANKVKPSKRCSDYEFIRRASLDIIGRIAKIEEIKKFMADPPQFRRSLLIERLLKSDESDEFAGNFATIWTTLLMTRGANKTYREQMFLYLFDEFAEEDADWSKIVTELLTAKGKTNENGAVNFILAHLGEEFTGGRRNRNRKALWKEQGRFEMVPVTSRTTKLFLGLQIQCTQCHDHKFWPDVWQQRHFWGVNAFFRQVDAPLGPPINVAKKKGNFAGQKELEDNPNFNTNKIVSYERRSGTLRYTDARFLDGRKPKAGSGKSRREQLADFVVSSPYFAKAFVNRMWGHFLGVSFTKHDVADFGDHNKVTKPELKEGEPKDWLLDMLAKDWAKNYGHNPRHLVRWICNSKAYNLSSVANKSNGTMEAEPLFARVLLKAMTPEQLFESLMVATRYQGAANTDDRKKLREEWLGRLVINFGDDEGNEQTFNGTVVQALLMMNGQDINKAIMDKKNGTVAQVLKKTSTPKQAMEYLYMAALNRPPTEAEYAKILTKRMALLPRVRSPRNAKEVQAFWAGFYQDLFWAILNSNEFFLNH